MPRSRGWKQKPALDQTQLRDLDRPSHKGCRPLELLYLVQGSDEIRPQGEEPTACSPNRDGRLPNEIAILLATHHARPMLIDCIVAGFRKRTKA